MDTRKVNIIFTTDIHGNYFPYDFRHDCWGKGSLQRVNGFVAQQVRRLSGTTILIDGGDILQGEPTAYYFNFVDRATRNKVSDMCNFIGYDVGVIGNHDIEAQHRVFDKVVAEINAPVLAANVINEKTGQPYFKPYTIISRAGKKICIFGLLTPYIPNWLPAHYWSGMHFEDMVESARKWIPIIQQNEKPDVLIGLFHSGFDYTYGGQTAATPCNENASVLVAQQVEGFDALLVGHDHKIHQTTVKSPSGKDVPLLDAGTGARYLGLLSINFDHSGKPVCKATLKTMTNIPESDAFNKTFLPNVFAVRAYTKKKIGVLAHSVVASESLAGNSAFVDVVHRAMLNITHANISMTAPLQIGTTLPEGPINVGRIFSLYRFENTLCVLQLTGDEVRRYLEYSYNLWVSNPSQTGSVLNLSKPGKLKNNIYHFDSAAGINYTVDVTKPTGQRVNITSMADGSKFDPTRTYQVALNSYRACGGGGHLSIGLGLSPEQIKQRTIKHIDHDIRGMLIAEFEKMSQSGKPINLQPLSNWRFVPEKVVRPQLDNDMKSFR